ncbi:MAG: putative hydrolase or acyltransferase of alpha/beta superfamily [Myxococcaceae bacterium]|nr:putative hydrolase or acyltransferase of alpha/beta superfamily [Myxococcaceae bacterium]
MSAIPQIEACARAASSSWPHVDGVRHGFVSVGQSRIHYAEAGAGEPLVLLHGWPQHWWSFRKIIAPLALHYRVICPDIRGLGWSTGSDTGYELIRLAADLLALMDELGLQRVRLVGHDWGAAIGYTACLQWPARIQKFVALAAVTPWSAEDGLLRLLAQAWHVSAMGVAGVWAMRALALPERALARWPGKFHFDDRERATYLARIHTPAARRATSRYYANVTFRELPWFIRHSHRLRLKTPTLHLNGALDPLTRGVGGAYARYADDMKLSLLPDCGHFIPEERPSLLLQHLLPFLARSHGAPSSAESSARSTSP